MAVQSYRDLKVWQAGVELVTRIYGMAEKLPKTESFGLASQIQRAAVSIPSNIAEGHARESDREFQRFLLITMGSLAELETQLIIGKSLRYFSEEETQSVLIDTDRLGKMIRNLQKTVKGKKPQKREASR